MKKLDVNQMENVQGGEACSYEYAGFYLGVWGVMAAGGPLGAAGGAIVFAGAMLLCD